MNPRLAAHRTIAAATFTILALGFTACGDDDSEDDSSNDSTSESDDGPTLDEFTAAANEICLDARNQLGELLERAAEGEDVDVFVEGIAVERQKVESLGALEAPSEIADQVADLLAAFTASIDDREENFLGGDEDLGEDAIAKAEDLDLTECAV